MTGSQPRESDRQRHGRPQAVLDHIDAVEFSATRYPFDDVLPELSALARMVVFVRAPWAPRFIRQTGDDLAAAVKVLQER